MKIKTEWNGILKETGYSLDFESELNYFGVTTEELNAKTLDEFYKAVEWLLSKGFDDYKELESNTINPVQQNIFIPLRVYRVFKNGHYRTFKIFQRALGGIYITEGKW